MTEPLKLMNPIIDFVFKNIFGNEKHPNILISFLNGVLGLKEQNKIIKVQILNPNIDKESIDDKYSILDVKAMANDNTMLDIEIQVRNNYDMIPRTLYYLSKLIEGQMESGVSYNTIKKSVTINVLDFELLIGNRNVHNAFLFKEKQTNEILTDLAEIHFLELPKLPEIAEDDNRTKDLLTDWLLFIRNPESEVVKMLTNTVPEINEAKSVLVNLSLNSEARMIYETRRKAVMDGFSALASAEERGKIEGIKEGKIEGIKEGIKDIIDLKFGETAYWFLDKINIINDLEVLENIKSALKKADKIEDVKIN